VVDWSGACVDMYLVVLLSDGVVIIECVVLVLLSDGEVIVVLLRVGVLLKVGVIGRVMLM